jgi:TPR repeat protein
MKEMTMKDKGQEKQSAYMKCKMVYDVFISYRRATGVNDARLLQQALKARGYNVFFDYDSLRVGKFNEKIFKAIESAPVFILMLTEGSLDACVKEGDWVRAEIEHALDHGRQIIPVTTSVQTLSFPDNLPPKLKDIPFQQVSEMNKTSLFEESIDKIIENCFPEDLKRRRRFLGIADGGAIQVEAPENNAGAVPFSRLLTTFLESLPQTHEGRERNILKHFNAGTAEELEDGAALLAWVDSPSEKLLDAAEMARYRLLDIQAWRSAESIKSWFRVMSDRGNVIAMDHYGWMLVDSEAEERVYWFRKAAELGGAHAQNSLGYCLHEGLGVEKNRDEALRLFRLSAEQGNRFGQESLARAYYEPDFAGLPQNPVEAFRLLTLSAGQGWHWSQFHLGEFYEKGFGTNPDMAKARRWYEDAAKAGNTAAKAALERLNG